MIWYESSFIALGVTPRVTAPADTNPSDAAGLAICFSCLACMFYSILLWCRVTAGLAFGHVGPGLGFWSKSGKTFSDICRRRVPCILLWIRQWIV